MTWKMTWMWPLLLNFYLYLVSYIATQNNTILPLVILNCKSFDPTSYINVSNRTITGDFCVREYYKYGSSRLLFDQYSVHSCDPQKIDSNNLNNPDPG